MPNTAAFLRHMDDQLRSSRNRHTSTKAQINIKSNSSKIEAQMTNPKAALSWIAIVSLGLQPAAPAWVGATIIGVSFLMSLAIHCLYAVAFSTPAMVRAYGKARRTIQTLLGAFFAFAGIKLLTSR